MRLSDSQVSAKIAQLERENRKETLRQQRQARKQKEE